MRNDDCFASGPDAGDVLMRLGTLAQSVVTQRKETFCCHCHFLPCSCVSNYPAAHSQTTHRRKRLWSLAPPLLLGVGGVVLILLEDSRARS
ncbi:Uncharacterized protein APZ42_011661 [Daphnia magna]|uniref:Uncharacterized protein n=1 Tax=Daphnia magna TaxID=35525 RepID=A0A162SVT2_9CRUS|nr:Uncharacterized protein APZ42_011661 [Daphnia magna]